MRYAKCPIIEVTKKFKEDGKLIGIRKASFIHKIRAVEWYKNEYEKSKT